MRDDLRPQLPGPLFPRIRSPVAAKRPGESWIPPSGMPWRRCGATVALGDITAGGVVSSRTGGVAAASRIGATPTSAHPLAGDHGSQGDPDASGPSCGCGVPCGHWRCGGAPAALPGGSRRPAAPRCYRLRGATGPLRAACRGASRLVPRRRPCCRDWQPAERAWGPKRWCKEGGGAAAAPRPPRARCQSRGRSVAARRCEEGRRPQGRSRQ